MECQSMPCPWMTATTSFPKGGMLPLIHLPSLYPILRKSPEGEGDSVEVSVFLGHLQDWAPLLPSRNHDHSTMRGKSEAL